MKETMRRIGWQVMLTVTVIVMMALECAIAEAFGFTVNGMTYMEYFKWNISNRPVLVASEALLIGWLIGNFNI